MFSLFLFAVLFGLCTVGNASVFCFPSCSFRCFLIFFKPKLILICLLVCFCLFSFVALLLCFSLVCVFCFALCVLLFVFVLMHF